MLRDRVPRVWTLWTASRPAQLFLVVAVYALGVAITLAHGSPLAERRLLAGLAALVPTAAGIHYANEYADAETDALTDRTPFSGGSGALQSTDVRRSVQYSLPPFAFARRGLGELLNAALGGIALPCYGAAVTGGLDRTAVLAVVPFSWFVLANMLETQWPDRHADADVGKDTLAVRWRPRRLRVAYAIAVLAGFGTLLALTAGVTPVTPDVFPWLVTFGTLSAMPLFAWGTVRFTRRRVPYPAVVGMVQVAVLQLVAWTVTASG
ncbi:1,4-dihydroxy-2-naphthoate octaprenyltransferase [Halobacteriales archaeon SW_12_69_24]|nr:MAG: 1,4-dihydroxy-2-naphthoate octaprenyltransferase [Halobacteriales archaeon SW_12_69_24]